MTVTSTLHVNFRGNARQALEFYHSIFGGDLFIATYSDVPAGQDPDQADQVAWGQVSSPDGFRVMAHDVQNSLPWNPGENPFYLALRSTDADEVNRYWHALLAGATIVEDLGPAVFSPLYGKLVDQFGVTWIIDVVVAPGWAKHPARSPRKPLRENDSSRYDAKMTVHHIEPRWTDLDPAGHANNSVFLVYAEEARKRLLPAVLPEAWSSIVVVHNGIDYHRPVLLEDRLEVSSAVEKIGTSSVTTVSVIATAAERCATVRTVQVVLGADGYGTRPWTAEERAALTELLSGEGESN